MKLADLKRKLKERVSKDVEDVFEELKRILKEDIRIRDEVMLIEGNYNQWRRNKRLGIRNVEDETINISRIRHSVVDIINDLAIEDIKPAVLQERELPKIEGPFRGDQLLELIGHLDPEVDIATTLYFVNCNRQRSLKTIWEAFHSFYQEHRSYQFYFFSACSTQRPTSFSERVVYEVADFLEAEAPSDKAFRYWPEPRNQRVALFRLPIGHSLKQCKVKFVQFLQKKLEFKGKSTIETYLNSGEPPLRYSALAMVFGLRENAWKPFFPEYFQWIIDTFSKAKIREECPTFLFFFSVEVAGIHKHSPEDLKDHQKTIYDELEGLVSNNLETTVHLSRLKPVHKTYIKDWLFDIGETNDGTQEKLIQLMAGQDTLSQEDRHLFLNEEKLNMDDIERFQKYLLKYADRKHGLF